MLKFKCTLIARRDARGRLVRCGVEWVEERAIAGPLLIACFLFGWLAMGLLFVEFASGHGPIFLKLSLVFCGLAGASCWSLRKWGRVRRRIVFYPSGRIASPGGLPYFPKCRKWNVRLDQLSTFELAPWGGPEHAVALYTTAGDTFIVARGLWQVQARKVTAQLNNQMRDMRDQRAAARPAARNLRAVVR